MFCFSNLHSCIFFPATTTISIDNLQTDIIDTTPTCSINNPYNYPFTIDENCSAIFILPNGSTTTDGTLKLYNTIAKNILNTNEVIYNKYYPSTYYEYDNRGVVTINIPFNGKVIGTYKYNNNTGSTLPAEVSYIHNSYNSTPVLQTDSTGSTTAVIKRDVWGDMLSNNYNSNEIIPTSYGLTGHKWDDNAGITYSHARYLSNANKVWLSHDPFSIENFNQDIWLLNPQYQNSYSYSTNDPVNKLDPDGKLTIIVPGTYYSPSTWDWSNTDTNFFYSVAGTSAQNKAGDTTMIWNDKSKWSGDNSDDARRDAASQLAKFINNYDFKDGETLNLVGHSHGGNVIKEASHLITRHIDNAILIGTPQRQDHKMNKDKVANYVNVYSWWDGVQISGGEMFDNKPVRWLAGKVGVNISPFEGGPASRWDIGAKPVNVNLGAKWTDPISMHGLTWSNNNFWSTYVAPVVHLPNK